MQTYKNTVFSRKYDRNTGHGWLRGVALLQDNVHDQQYCMVLRIIYCDCDLYVTHVT